MLNQHRAQEERREAMQGKGRPIISTEVKGYRFVAVDNEVLYGKWRTFEEFLMYYLRHSFGVDWGRVEQLKPPESRHPILQWWSMHMAEAQSMSGNPDQIVERPMSGVSQALLALAYNLYLLKHNAELKSLLIKRLKHVDQFYGAYYETLVASWFILAGFKLHLLDESSGLVRNCEFNAEAPSGRVFSVEAKSRLPGKATNNVSNQLVDALRKDAAHERIIFIDLNTSDPPSESLAVSIGDSIRSREQGLLIAGKPAPPAYVLVTNHPYHFDLLGHKIDRFMVAEGFKIPDFGTCTFTSLIDMFKAERSHAEVHEVFDAFAKYQIPSTFDGELPEVTYGGVTQRWLVGEQYSLAMWGVDEHGSLASAQVEEASSKVHLVFMLPRGEIRIMTDQLSPAEFSAYRRHPESFFGKQAGGRKKTDKPLDLFKFFYNAYQLTPKERLLEFMSSAPDLHALRQLQDEDLLLEYCNRHTLAALRQGFAMPDASFKVNQGGTGESASGA